MLPGLDEVVVETRNLKSSCWTSTDSHGKPTRLARADTNPIRTDHQHSYERTRTRTRTKTSLRQLGLGRRRAPACLPAGGRDRTRVWDCTRHRYSREMAFHAFDGPLTNAQRGDRGEGGARKEPRVGGKRLPRVEIKEVSVSEIKDERRGPRLGTPRSLQCSYSWTILYQAKIEERRAAGMTCDTQRRLRYSNAPRRGPAAASERARDLKIEGGSDKTAHPPSGIQ